MPDRIEEALTALRTLGREEGEDLWARRALLDVAGKVAQAASASEAVRRELLERAAAELRACLMALQDAGTARGAEAAGVAARALSALFAELNTSGARAGERGAGESPAGEARRDPATRTTVNAAALDNTIGALVRLHVRRVALVQDVVATFVDLRACDQAIARAGLSLRWMVNRALADAQLDAVSLSRRPPLQALVAFAHIGDRDSTARAFDLVHALAHDPTVLGVAVDALRIAEGVDAPRRMRALFGAATSPTLRALLVPALIEHQRLKVGDLVAALDDRHEDVAAAAASALPWLGAHAESRRLLDRGACGGVAGEAALFAALCLGADEALPALRAAVGSGAASSYAIDALAVAGEACDIPLLVEEARHGRQHAARAVLAACHLGDPGTWSEIEPIAARFGFGLLETARRALLGTLEPSDGLQGRCLGGRAWSVDVALERLAGPEEALCLRRWAALDAAVRTGASLPRPYEVAASVSRQEAAAGELARRLARSGDGLPSGRWYYLGRPRA